MHEHELAERDRLYMQGCAEFASADPEIRALAVANCDLCDGDGYRGARVCDHVDYREISVRGHALASQALKDARTRRDAEKQQADT